MGFPFIITLHTHTPVGKSSDLGDFTMAMVLQNTFFPLEFLSHILPLHPPSHLSQISATALQRSQTGALLPAALPRPHTANEAHVRAHIVSHNHCRGVAVLHGVPVHVEQGP